MPRAPRLGVDVGTVRVGVAASDPDGILATPVDTVERGKSIDRIAAEVLDRGVSCVYVGLPTHLSGAEGRAATGARAYAGELAHAVAPVSVRLVDERLSTTIAHQALRAAGRPTRNHRKVVDQAAAVVILQDALNGERASGRRAGTVVEVSEDSSQIQVGAQQDTADSGDTQ